MWHWPWHWSDGLGLAYGGGFILPDSIDPTIIHDLGATPTKVVDADAPPHPIPNFKYTHQKARGSMFQDQSWIILYTCLNYSLYNNSIDNSNKYIKPIYFIVLIIIIIIPYRRQEKKKTWISFEIFFKRIPLLLEIFGFSGGQLPQLYPRSSSEANEKKHVELKIKNDKFFKKKKKPTSFKVIYLFLFFGWWEVITGASLSLSEITSK